jgi:aminoglycoside 6'-N-acetyltransferase I
MIEAGMRARIANTDDLATLVTLRFALWPHLDISAHEQLLRRRFENGARFATMVLLDTAGQLSGFVELMRDPGLPGEAGGVSLQAVFVTPSMRRRGGATELLAAAQRWAHGRGATSLYCDLSLDDEQARDTLRFLGFAEDQRWVRASRPISAPPEVTAPDEPVQAVAEAAEAPQADEPVVVQYEKVRSPLALIVNIVIFAAAVAAFAFTNIYSNDPIRGMLLPLLDVVFVLYFLFLWMAARYRKRTDSNARADLLFRVDE